MDPPPPPHTVPVLFPKAESKQELLGTEIRYRDPKGGKTITFTVGDCVTSRLRGDWFVVMYDNGEEAEVSASEMKEILNNRVY